MAQSPAQLIKEMGASAIATAINQRPATVRMWKRRNRIPRTVWPELQEAYPDTLTIEALKAVEALGA